MKYDVAESFGTWVPYKTSKGLLTLEEAKNVCRIKNSKRPDAPNVLKRRA